jgi:hypothetical protein
MLDGTPGTNTFNDGALPQGSTFSDGNVSIAVDSASGGQATVSVVIGSVTDSEAPTSPANFTATAVQGGADLAWSASTDNVGVTGYRIIRDNAIVATTTSLAYADRNLAPSSSHSYRVQAMDAAGNGAPSAIRYVTVPDAPDPGPGTDPGTDDDLTSPVVHLLSPKSRSRLRRRALIVARASDDRGVARIELLIDGRRARGLAEAHLGAARRPAGQSHASRPRDRLERQHRRPVGPRPRAAPPLTDGPGAHRVVTGHT